MTSRKHCAEVGFERSRQVSTDCVNLPLWPIGMWRRKPIESTVTIFGEHWGARTKRPTARSSRRNDRVSAAASLLCRLSRPDRSLRLPPTGPLNTSGWHRSRGKATTRGAREPPPPARADVRNRRPTCWSRSVRSREKQDRRSDPIRSRPPAVVRTDLHAAGSRIRRTSVRRRVEG